MHLLMGQAEMRTLKIEDVMVNFFYEDRISFNFLIDKRIINFNMEDINDFQRLSKLKEFAGVSIAKDLEGKELRWVDLSAFGHPTEDKFILLYGDIQELTKSELMEKLKISKIFE